MRSLKVPKESQLHKDLVKRIESLWSLAQKGRTEIEDKWRRAEEITLAYVPETELSVNRRNNRDRGKPDYTTIQIPYTYALLMSAHTYWTSVFFARSPVHQFAGRHGETEQQVQAVDALVSYQTEVGGFLGPYYIWVYDTGKYGIGVLGSYWQVEKIHYGSIVEMPPEFEGGPIRYGQITEEVEGYRGNKVFNISPYDFWPDPRVPVSRFQEGEFCVVRCRLGWTKILRRVDDGYFINLDELKKHKSEFKDSQTTQGSAQLRRPEAINSPMYDNEADKDGHPSGGEFLEFYIELVPNEWGLGNLKFPIKWCITTTADRTLIVGASPLGFMHGKFPIDVAESEVEGYGIFNRGIPEIMEPIQNTMDWLINSHFYNVRAAMNIQAIVDPSKLIIKNNGGPGFIWQLRPEAYGADITKMFHQIQVQDVTRGHMSDLQGMLQIGERTLGVNDQIMGALSTGGRKTATEVRTSTGFGVNRLKTVSEYLSATAFGPHALKLLATSQQMYDVQGKLRIVGDLAPEAGAGFMNVTPELIAGHYNHVPIDGTLPVDRMAQANLWKEIFAGIRNMPLQVQASYDWGRMFAWAATLGGLRNIHQFKIKVVPDAQLQQQAQVGNVVPMPQRALPASPGASPGNAASTAAGLNALQQ